MPIPWRDKDIDVQSNLPVAQARLNSLQVSLKKRNLFEAYDNEIQKLLSRHYAEKVPLFDIDKGINVWYLPHQAVVSEKKPGKLRVVFDCASRYMGESLNDKCLQGPDVNNKLMHVLLRFRNHLYALTADIEAMYYQVRVTPVDRDYLRFLWFNNDGCIEHLRMSSHVFGGVWCSSVATYALRKTVHDFGYNKLINDVVENAFYVDDCLVSVQTVEEAVNVVTGVQSLLSKGGFNLTKFVVNNTEVLSSVPECDRAMEVKSLQSECHSKVLGIKWDVKTDSIYFDVNVMCNKPLTRRIMLSIVSSLYDPLGLVIPILIPGKLLFQDATRMKLNWDDEVPPDMVKRWHMWVQSLQGMKNIQIPRCIKPFNSNDASLELHHFSDASGKAYGCCTYLRCVNKNGTIHTALVCSKGRLAPLKSMTIPRLELQAAILAVRMDSVLREELQLDLNESVFWVDSEIVLKYIKNEKNRYHVFVANRVSEIRSLTKPSQWNHISGLLNVSDIITRGIDSQRLMTSEWFEGPSFLKSFKSDWKIDDVNCDLDVSDPEVKPETLMYSKVQTHCCATDIQQHPIDVMIMYYSSWYKLKRAVCWWLRLKSCLRSKRSSLQGPLSVNELKSCEIFVIKHVQSQFYGNEVDRLLNGEQLLKSSRIRDLSPLIDKDGVLRVGGRIKHSMFQYDFKHPIVIPHKSPVALLIARDQHDFAHVGTEWTLSMLRDKYWITKARHVLRNVKSNCIKCKKLRGKTCVQRMADLPEERMIPDKAPFSYVGTDCFGPILVKLGRSEVKRYGCLFTCLTTRAVHLEVLNTMDTDTFINALRRFVARRGCPLKMWSDNGTNYVGCQNELKRCLKQLDHDKIYAHCTKQNIQWHFNTPDAPHMGGVFERMVQTVKRVLMAVIGNNQLNDEILCTLLCEVENIVNSRPITKVSDDSCDPVAITPNNFLFLHGGPSPILGKFDVADLYKKRWRRVQHMVDIFWKRWVREYLPLLQKVNKWHKTHDNLKVGDLVMIADENTPRGLWPLAIVTDVRKGRDGLVRTVHVRTKSSQLVRPVTKIILLEGH